MISSRIGTRMFSRQWLAKPGILGLVALAAALSSACGTPPAAVADPGSGVPNAGESAGSLSIAVVVPPNFQIDTISYQLTKPGFSQAGSLNVAQSGTISGVIGGIPAGTGYTLVLTATDVAKKFTGCAGSSTVNVTGGATTSVGVAIECRLPQMVVTSPPAVPVPLPAVVFLAIALLAAGMTATRRSGRR